MTQETQSIVNSLKKIIQLSEQMILSAEGANWDAVIQQEQSRRQLIESLDFGLIDDEVFEDLSTLFDRLLILNQSLAELGNTELTRCANELIQLGKSKKASNAYKEG
ncbi:MAG: flagellar protein FliT [Gammaproteobacteria bacterium]|nr:flagellar protein FliT [Gammaproteobacteria bacterium]MDH5694285.1 flagellar protein FliT [Gammaproteobacteria bacterium]